MKEVSGSLCDKSNFVLIYRGDAFLAPIKGPQNEISDNVVCAASKGSDQPVHIACENLIRAIASCLTVI